MWPAAVTLVGLLALPALASAAPCSAPSCREWVALGRGSARSLVYRSHPLDVRNETVRRALVIIHDASRDAEGFFRTALAAAFLAGALDDTIIIAPRFASNDGRALGCDDRLASNEVNWPCEGVSWRAGAAVSMDGRQVTSFDLIDVVLRQLARKNVFPNLRAIVVAGHSAGGQFVTRYEMANRIHDVLGVPVAYVVANPSSYAYPDPWRPMPTLTCADFDAWPYGLKRRTGYAASVSDARLKQQLASRPTTYLLGSLDVLMNEGFDRSCAAMAQGATRLARGEAYAGHIRGTLGARHTVVVVPACGHNARCMFTADQALPLLFPGK